MVNLGVNKKEGYMIEPYLIGEFVACQMCKQVMLVERVLNDVNHTTETFITCPECLGIDVKQNAVIFYCIEEG